MESLHRLFHSARVFVVVAAFSCGSGQSGRADLGHDAGGPIAQSVSRDGEADHGSGDRVDGSLDASGDAMCGGATWKGTRVGGGCYPGVGACLSKGVVTCVGGNTVACSATPGTPDDSYHAVAAPNGSWDWNCNNDVDRKYPLAACESFTATNCPAQGWAPQSGQSGDCGQMLVQTTCAVSGSGCQSVGSQQLVTEECK